MNNDKIKMLKIAVFVMVILVIAVTISGVLNDKKEEKSNYNISIANRCDFDRC